MTTNNIWKRGFVIADWCCLCKSDGESVSHLFLHCPLGSELLAFIFCLVGIAWFMPESVEAKLESCVGIALSFVLTSL